MQLWLVDHNPLLVEAWQKEFDGFSNVFICEADILSIAENTIVSPANSYGFMDGGIDQLYTGYFGYRPQAAIQEAIQKRPEGYLPVGAAVLVNTGDGRIPYMIAAPTMISPTRVRGHNCFFAMSAMLQIAWRHQDIVRSVFCPGLATGIGGVPYAEAAREMAFAYKKWCRKYGIAG